MAKIIGLPMLSPTMEEGTLAKWAKSEGDPVEVDDLLAEVETDKATMEFRSFDKGVLLKILAPEGSTLKPDAPVAIIGKLGEDIRALIAQAAAGSSSPAAAPAASAAAPVQTAAAPVQTAAAPAKMDAAVSAVPAPSAGGRVLASPYVRQQARERGIDLGGMQGTGPHGRVIKRDLDAGPAPQPVTTVVASRPDSRVEKLSQMRKTIARRLTESKQQVPHFYLTIDVNASRLVALREQTLAALEGSGDKVSVNDFVIRACALALRRVPEANASFSAEAITYHGRVDVSVAVAIADGLVTPVVRDADQKSVVEISREVRSLAARAKEKKLRPEEMMDGTFSVSNLGMFGIESFSAVINPPEGAILAVGAVRDEPVVENGVVVPGKRMRVTMSCDHRVVDGATGARWLAEFRKLVETPVSLFV